MHVRMLSVTFQATAIVSAGVLRFAECLLGGMTRGCC